MNWILGIFGVSIAGLAATAAGMLVHEFFQNKQIAANEAAIEKFLGLPTGDIAATVEALLPGVINKLVTTPTSAVAAQIKSTVTDQVAAVAPGIVANQVAAVAPAIITHQVAAVAPAIVAQVIATRAVAIPSPAAAPNEDRAYAGPPTKP